MDQSLAAPNYDGQPPVAQAPIAALTDSGRPIDRAAVERAAADLLEALGADLRAPGLRDTPRVTVHHSYSW